MRGLVIGLILTCAGSAAGAQPAPCAQPVWDKFCVGMTPKEVEPAYGGRKAYFEVEHKYTIRTNWMNTGDTLSDITVKFDDTTPDTLVAQLTVKYGKPTIRQFQGQVWQSGRSSLSNGPTEDRYEWRQGPVIISTDVPHDPSMFSEVQYRIVDEKAPAVPL